MTYEGIKEKLDSSRRLLEGGGSVNISAALYTFALEEYGKFLLLEKSQIVKGGNRRVINYNSEFANHEKKFEIACDDLQKSGHEECFLLDDEAEFNPKEFYWKDFNLGLLADMTARLSIIHSDLKPPTDDPSVQDLPPVKKNVLMTAINELESVVSTIST